MTNLPNDFDASFYRLQYADLADLSDADLANHWTRHGASEGRSAAADFVRADLIAWIGDRPALEIGPFTTPTLRGGKVRYFDVADRDALLIRAREIGHPATDPVDIDYFHPTGDLSVIPDTFDIVFSSHCIEHQPDLVRHLVQVEALLNAQGAYALVIPDKRFCFDHFVAEKTIADVLQAHSERRMTHTLKSVIEARALTSHNIPAKHWSGEHSVPIIALEPDAVQRAVKEFEAANGGYIDVHAWQFTPIGFRAIVDQLNRLGLIRLKAERVFATPHGCFEFCAVLRLD